jgi:integrase/recombinase XerD
MGLKRLFTWATRTGMILSDPTSTLKFVSEEAPMNAATRSILGKYLAKLLQECQYLFPSEETRKVLTGRAPGHLITKYALRAQVADFSPHDLRHHFGYGMEDVVPLHRLDQIVGHDSLDTTMLYIRRTKQDLQEGVERIAWM